MKSFTHLIFMLTVFVSFLLFHSFSAEAQISYGVKGGLVMSSVKKQMKYNSSYSYDARPKEGAQFGIWMFAPGVYRNLGIQAEVLYSNKGSEYITTSRYHGYGGYSPYSYSSFSPYGYGYPNQGELSLSFANEALHTLNLPVLLVFRSDKIFRPYLGAELSYLMKVNDQPPFGASDYKKISFGAIAGVQVKLANKVTADLRYNFGITPYKHVYSADKAKFSNRGFEMSVAYQLGSLAKK